MASKTINHINTATSLLDEVRTDGFNGLIEDLIEHIFREKVATLSPIGSGMDFWPDDEQRIHSPMLGHIGKRCYLILLSGHKCLDS